MKKGFTLIELLIVMVVVTILVTVALPAYKTSMEKSRALEGVANAAAVSDAINAFYVRNGNSYGSQSALSEFALGTDDDGGVAGITRNKNFNTPVIAVSGSTATVTVMRSTQSYSITYTNSYGRTTGRSCSGNSRYCKAIGL